MPAFEYLVVRHSQGVEFEVAVEGHRARSAHEKAARAKVRALVAADTSLLDGERVRWDHAVRDADQEERVARDRERAELYEEYEVESVLALDRERQEYLVTKQIVKLPDGSSLQFEGEGGSTWVDDQVAVRLGVEPDRASPVEPDEAQLIAGVMARAKVTSRTRWFLSIMPERQPGTADAEDGEVIQLLNDLGADGWRLVDVSEDRAIVSGDSGTQSKVVAARYTLLREVGA